MKAERNRNRALGIVREQLSNMRADRDRMDTAIGVLANTEAALVEAYARKPARTPRTPRVKSQAADEKRVLAAAVGLGAPQ